MFPWDANFPPADCCFFWNNSAPIGTRCPVFSPRGFHLMKALLVSSLPSLIVCNFCLQADHLFSSAHHSSIYSCSFSSNMSPVVSVPALKKKIYFMYFPPTLYFQLNWTYCIGSSVTQGSCCTLTLFLFNPPLLSDWAHMLAIVLYVWSPLGSGFVICYCLDQV